MFSGNTLTQSTQPKARLRGIAAAIAVFAIALAVCGVQTAGATITNVTTNVRFDCNAGVLVAYAPEAKSVFGNRPNARINIASRVQWLSGGQWVNLYTTPEWAYSFTFNYWGSANPGYGLSYASNNQTWISTGAISNQHPAAGQMFNYATPWVSITVTKGFTYRVITVFHDLSDGSFSGIVNHTTTGSEGCRQ